MERSRRSADLRAREDRRVSLRGAASNGAHREFRFEWTPIRNGISDVAGVPAAVCRAFSRRRVEIEAEMERRGNWTAAAAQAAALETRRSKDRLIDARRLMPEWRARAEANGLSVDLVAGLFHRRHALELDFANRAGGL